MQIRFSSYFFFLSKYVTEMPNAVEVLQDRDLLINFPKLLLQLVGRTARTKKSKWGFRYIFNRCPSNKALVRADFLTFGILAKLFPQSLFIKLLIDLILESFCMCLAKPDLNCASKGMLELFCLVLYLQVSRTLTNSWLLTKIALLNSWMYTFWVDLGSNLFFFLFVFVVEEFP